MPGLLVTGCRIIARCTIADDRDGASQVDIGYDRRVEPASLDAEFRRLVDDYRARCLWFLRDDYYPETAPARERVLAVIARHGDQDAFRRVANVRTWLSQFSNETSVGS